ncbi:MAG TPA: helix-turn-helix transcriptional regulator [Ktedonobacterales bacterium]|nr:helix-turn-helix transcriptional regulator [Ktedonobacterales bacterium]
MIQNMYYPSNICSHRASTLESYNQAVEQVIGVMRTHLADSLSLEDMADAAYLSPFHFNRIFRSMTNIPPGEYLSALRLEEAKRLLLTTNTSVTDVCFEVGYTSLGTFTTRFNQAVGLSPSQLRAFAQRLSDIGPITLPKLPPLSLPRYMAGRAGVYGQISAPTPISSLIMAGLFPKAIPQSHPAAGVTLTAPGPYRIAPVPDGVYYLLVAALPTPVDPLTALLPDSGILVSASQRPIVVQNGYAQAPVNLTLRPFQIFDPPILIALPLLLASRLATLRSLLR